MERRRQIGQWVDYMWTRNGVDDSGLAPVFWDGRLDALSDFVFDDDDDDDDDDDGHEKNDESFLGTLSSHHHHVQDPHDNDDNDDDDDGHYHHDENVPDQKAVDVVVVTTTNTAKETTPKPPPLSIDRWSAQDLSPTEFGQKYLQRNQPVLLQGLADTWPATTAWVQTRPPSSSSSSCCCCCSSSSTFSDHQNSSFKILHTNDDDDETHHHHHHVHHDVDDDDDDGPPILIRVPHLDYLDQCFGHQRVPVYEQTRPGFTADRPIGPHDWTLHQYADWWKQQHPDHDHHHHSPEATPRWYYLKDWKFVAANPTYPAYQCPTYFQDDWLNPAVGKAYQFVYWGPAGTVTPLHEDVLRSYSWSTNLCGTKEWYLIPPSEAGRLWDCLGRRRAPHLHADLQQQVHPDLYAGLARVRRRAWRVRQQAGETIFVPSHWYHQVHNLQDTLSINHNWLNATNVEQCLDKVLGEWYRWREATRTLENTTATEDDQPTEEPPLMDPPPSSTRLGSTSEDTHPAQQQQQQVYDDLVLLWQVIVHKAEAMWQKHAQNRLQPPTKEEEPPRREPPEILRDLHALEAVLLKMKRLWWSDQEMLERAGHMDRRQIPSITHKLQLIKKVLL